MRLDRVDSAADSPAFASAARITRCWDGPLGAVKPFDRAVLIHRRAPHHRQHLVAVAPRVRQPLQHQHTDALGPAVAVGAVGERLAAAVRGQPALPAELDERAGRGHHGDAAGQGQRRTHPTAAPGTARCSATSDDEHAVSTVTAGPSRPNV